MIRIDALHKAFGIAVPPEPPHCFRIGEAGEIVLPAEDDVAPMLHFITRAPITLPLQIEQIVRAMSALMSTPNGTPDIFVSRGRSQRLYVHFLSPSPRDESAEVLARLKEVLDILEEKTKKAARR